MTKVKVLFEQIVAGALLQFEKIDHLDIHLFMEELNQCEFVEVDFYFDMEDLRKYINVFKDGTFSRKEEFSFDTYISECDCTLKEKFSQLAGEVVTNYFNQLNIEEYYKEKERLLERQKASLLERSNVLLISDMEEDYNALREYGFKNIDYFKSIIRADRYFQKHPEELNNYHIILKGNQNVQHCCFGGQVQLDSKIIELSNQNHIIETSLRKYQYPDHNDYIIDLYDFCSFKSWTLTGLTYSEVFDGIVETSLINHTLDIAQIQNEIHPIEDYINPNRLPLPTKKSDLKILYLESYSVSEYAQELAIHLGLNITFKQDCNSGLGEHVKSALGDYDIIIVSDSFSSNILNMNHESTEQCKDTGRDLTLLVTYDYQSIAEFDEDGMMDYDGFGDELRLKYTFGGDLSKQLEPSIKEYRVLRKMDGNQEKDHWIKYKQSQKADMKSIIEETVSLYNDALIKTKNSSLKDFDFKRADEYDREYSEFIKKEENRKQEVLAPICDFHSLESSVINYLDYKKCGFIKGKIDGLRIFERNDGIYIENIYNHRIMCTLILSKKEAIDNFKIFSVQTLSKKGILGNPEIVGLYTHKFEKLEGVPPKPNEKQMNAIISIEKKVDHIIRPLNMEAFEKILEQEEKQFQLKRKISKVIKIVIKIENVNSKVRIKYFKKQVYVICFYYDIIRLLNKGNK